MYRNDVNLHVSRKMILVLVLSFTVLILLANVIICIMISSDLAQLQTAYLSKYDYSAVSEKKLKEDDYYFFDAEISFNPFDNSDHCLNVEILMQGKDIKYTDLIYWTPQKLNSDEIAVSRNIAIREGLELGDTLYSKHIVDGLTYRYIIKEIIPEVNCSRVSGEVYKSDGLIIMGYDDRYVNNLTHRHIVYSKEPFNELFTESSGTLNDLIYRDDEMVILCKRSIPYVVFDLLFSGICTVVVSLLLYKEIKSNFRRLIVIGFKRTSLNAKFNYIVVGNGFIAISMCLLVSLLFRECYRLSFFLTFVFSLAFLFELLILVASALFVRRKAWRG